MAEDFGHLLLIKEEPIGKNGAPTLRPGGVVEKEPNSGVSDGANLDDVEIVCSSDPRVKDETEDDASDTSTDRTPQEIEGTFDPANESPSEDVSSGHANEATYNLRADPKRRRLKPLKPSIICGVCGREFWKRSYFESHMRTHTGEKPYTCNICNKQFGHSGTLTSHMQTHGGEKLYACEQCDYRGLRASNLKAHIIRVHSLNKPFSCDVCGLGCGNKAELRRHIMSHTGEKPFACDMCDFKTKRANALKIHTRRVHTGEKPFPCHLCDRRFTTRGDLDRHFKTHTETAKVYACELCESRFAQAKYLETHLKTTHSEAQTHYACSECDYTSSRVGKLNQHKARIHSSDKPYQCTVCDRKFSLESDLNRHVKTHTMTKLHACDVCDHRFWQASQLKVHMRSHTGEKPFSCDLCGFKCGRKNSLTMHLSRVHKTRGLQGVE